MKRAKYLIGIFCALVLMLGALAGCNAPEEGELPGGGKPEEKPVIAVQSVTLNVTELELNIGDTRTLTATVMPLDATNKRVNWVTNDDGVATVSSLGTVTAVGAGSATITATAGKFSATCTVNVAAIEVAGIELSAERYTLPLGEQHALTVTYIPANATDKTVTWASSDPTVAAVYEGMVTGLKAGTAVITATTANGLIERCTYTVSGEETDYSSYTHIKTVEDYLAIAPDNGKYCLDNDIDFKGADVPCIGNYGAYSKVGFQGIFDGRGYSLLNANFVSSDEKENNNCAMFYMLNSQEAAVRNVNFIDCICEGVVYDAIVTVWLEGGTIENCYIQSYVANNNDYWDGWTLGGIIACVAQTDTSKIRNCVVCSASGGITYGIVGSNYTGDEKNRAVENCYVITPAGGEPMNLVGDISAEWSGGAQPIFNCYSLSAEEALTDPYTVLNRYYWQIEEGKLPYLRNPEGTAREYTGYERKVIVTVEESKTIYLSGGKKQLHASCKPEGLNATLTYVSDNESVVTVSETGILTPVATGTATITVTAEGGATATCVITVAE